ncbi:sigma factor-like helix-turn-helix DNA-binding protein [Streptomyces sp. NPDC056361]|uniref:sigma factor-like helix-turn-helix DNA-binding protein n=1 Tax=Streptomyces sp. NPDC056361 TaxID=3345795 RepID=UPI0035D79DA4
MDDDTHNKDDRAVAARFEEERQRLRAVAYRLLGTFDEADDAVREAVLRAAREAVRASVRRGDPPTEIVARVCLERLRAREAHRGKPWDPWDPWAVGAPNRPHRPDEVSDPGRRALLAADSDSTAPDLPQVLDGLTPSERLAYVLHDLFSEPYEEIAGILDRTPSAARQLAGRARHRVGGAEEMPHPDPDRGREVVAALLEAARNGDLDGLLALLDPDVVLRADAAAVRAGTAAAHGAPAVARPVARHARAARPALVDGMAGLVEGDPAGSGDATAVLGFTVLHDLITSVDLLADADHLSRLDLRLLDGTRLPPAAA